MSASDGNGAYQNDESYNKYSDSGRGKLVCDFVIGGNTSRQPAGSSLRTNNYSPTGYLNKKGESFPVTNVRTSYTIHRSIHGLSSVWLSFIWGMPRLVWNVMI